MTRTQRRIASGGGIARREGRTVFTMGGGRVSLGG